MVAFHCGSSSFQACHQSSLLPDSASPKALVWTTGRVRFPTSIPVFLFLLTVSSTAAPVLYPCSGDPSPAPSPPPPPTPLSRHPQAAPLYFCKSAFQSPSSLEKVPDPRGSADRTGSILHTSGQSSSKAEQVSLKALQGGRES